MTGQFGVLQAIKNQKTHAVAINQNYARKLRPTLPQGTDKNKVRSSGRQRTIAQTPVSKFHRLIDQRLRTVPIIARLRATWSGCVVWPKTLDKNTLLVFLSKVFGFGRLS